MRRLTVNLHLWAGLAVAIYAILIGVSGTILMFRPEFTDSRAPEYRGAALGAPTATPSRVLTEVRSAYPGWRPLSLTWPSDESPLFLTYLLKPGDALEVFSDPQTGKIVGTRSPKITWLGAVETLHSSFYLGKYGRWFIQGPGAMGLLFLTITGVYLWFPKRRWGWRTRELHFGTGLVTAVYVAILSITGMYFVTPQVFVGIAGKLCKTPDPHPKIAKPDSSDSLSLLSLTDLAERAQATLPGHTIYRMQIVQRPADPVRVTFREGSAQQFHLVSTVFLHPVSGEVMQVVRLADRKPGDTFLGWIAALHFGIFGGVFVRILWAVLGLSLPVLSITGFLMWWKKQSVNRKRSRQAASLAQQL